MAQTRRDFIGMALGGITAVGGYLAISCQHRRECNSSFPDQLQPSYHQNEPGNHHPESTNFLGTAMIPEDRLSSSLVSADLVNPWSANRALSYHMGPVQLQDPSEGMLVKLWQARIIRSGEDELSLKEIALFAPGMEEVIRYVHTENIREVSLAFDQNANPYFALVTESGIPFLRWFDPTVESMVNLELDGSIVTPRITLDDVRSFNSSNSDVILAYVRAGLLRYRKQRDRWLTEYTPTQGVGGDPAEMQFLKHVSMNSALRLEFVSGDEEDPYIFLEAITDFDRTPDNKTALTAILEDDLIVTGKQIGRAHV